MTFPIYGIDRDNGNGRYVRRYSFTPFVGPVNHPDREHPGLVTHQDTNAGEIGQIIAPDGSSLVVADIGWQTDATLLQLPDNQTLTADEAFDTAKGSRPWLRMGLTLALDA